MKAQNGDVSDSTSQISGNSHIRLVGAGRGRRGGKGASRMGSPAYTNSRSGLKKTQEQRDHELAVELASEMDLNMSLMQP